MIITGDMPVEGYGVLQYCNRPATPLSLPRTPAVLVKQQIHGLEPKLGPAITSGMVH